MYLPQMSEHERRWASTSLVDHSPWLGRRCKRACGRPAVNAAIASGCSSSRDRTWAIVSGLSYTPIHGARSGGTLAGEDDPKVNSTLLELFRHKTWATLRLIEHCQNL